MAVHGGDYTFFLRHEVPIRVGGKAEGEEASCCPSETGTPRRTGCGPVLTTRVGKNYGEQKNKPRQKTQSTKYAMHVGPVFIYISRGALRSHYCLPTSIWLGKYGTLTTRRLILRRVTTCELVEHVVFFSTNPPGELMGLQDFKSEEMTTTTYVMDMFEQNSAHQPDAVLNAPASTRDFPAAPSERSTPSERNATEQHFDSSSYTRQFVRNPGNFKPFRDEGNPQTPNDAVSQHVPVKEEPFEEDEMRMSGAIAPGVLVKKETSHGNLCVTWLPGPYNPQFRIIISVYFNFFKLHHVR